MALRIAAGLY